MNASRRCIALFCLALAACAASPSPGNTGSETTATATVAESASAPAAADIDATSLRIGVQCDSDADCAVKDVGSCCGYYPRCVNKDSPTYPALVKAQCRKEGRSSTCGFPAISGCQCAAHECVNVYAGAANATPVR